MDGGYKPGIQPFFIKILMVIRDFFLNENQKLNKGGNGK